jgi:hypothetical protein
MSAYAKEGVSKVIFTVFTPSTDSCGRGEYGILGLLRQPLDRVKKCFMKKVSILHRIVVRQEGASKVFLTRFYSDTCLRVISNIQFSEVNKRLLTHPQG